MKPVITSPSASTSTTGTLFRSTSDMSLGITPEHSLVEVRQLGRRRVIVGDRHGELGPVLRCDFPHRILAHVHPRLRIGARNEVFRHRLSQSASPGDQPSAAAVWRAGATAAPARHPREAAAPPLRSQATSARAMTLQPVALWACTPPLV